MKITSMRPMVVTPAENVETMIETFEALGFAKKHTKSTIENSTASDVVMEDPDGHTLDVVASQVVNKDMMALRINVDNFEEACEFFESRGYHVATGKKQSTSTSKSCMMIAETGLGITIIEHIK